MPLEIRELETAHLSAPRQTKSYPGFHRWTNEEVNSIAVPVLGCLCIGSDEKALPTNGKDWRSSPVPPPVGWVRSAEEYLNDHLHDPNLLGK